LMLGVLMALALQSAAVRAVIEARRKAINGAGMLLALAVSGMALTHETMSSPRMVLYGYSVLALLYATVLVLALTGDSTTVLRRALRSPSLGWMGTLAYGTYLLHLPIAGISGLFIPSPAWAGAAGLVVTIVLARLSWKYLEQPLVKMGHRHHY